MYHSFEIKVYFSLSELTQTRNFLGFSTAYKVPPCKSLAEVQENVHMFITKQQDYKTLSFQRLHYIRAKSVASRHFRNVNNYQIGK